MVCGSRYDRKIIRFNATLELRTVRLAPTAATRRILSQCMVRSRMKRVDAFLGSVSALLLSVLVLQGCNALNPACGSARPVPVIASLSASTTTLAEVQQGFVLTVSGSHFVSSSVGVINGTMLATLVTSSTQLQITITTAVISAAGTANITVNTPSGNSAYLGCISGGTSSALTLTIT